MNVKLVTLLALCTSIAVFDSNAQNRDRQQGRGEGRGFGGPPGGDRGGPPGGERGPGQRPNMMTFLPVLKALDADGNGEISSKEIENAAAALKSLDRNNDGKLTEEELRPNGPPPGGRPGGDRPEGGNFGRPGGDRENMDRGRGFGGDRGGDRGGPPREGEGNGQGRPDPSDMVKRLMAFDKNGDGKLGKDELSERMQSLITRADTDKDGFASKEELLKLAGGQGGRGFGGPPGGGDRKGPPQGQGQGERPRRPEFEN